MQAIKGFPYLVINWDQECRSVILQWRGGFADRNLKEGLSAALNELTKRLPNAQWISDNTNSAVFSKEEKIWAETEFQAKLLATGVKYIAFVRPKSAVTQLSMIKTVSRFRDRQVKTHYCDTLREARQWMKEQDF